eukprot:TRINITY_DN76837_c0_g1_i1.p1 TRINITY_DN76837_c0_g1~~TRINITY_DN76837_c0_g1_i1.p1  ORF type:complete len:264 (-),score=28.01 TRINITY_DN76837_c0_g1_i1:89-880(-)
MMALPGLPARTAFEVLAIVLAFILGARFGSSPSFVTNPVPHPSSQSSECQFHHALSTKHGDSDEDNSLFYGVEAHLRLVRESSRRIPKDLYIQIVADFIIPCVDVVLQAADGRVLLVERRDEPMRGARWLIGGRMLKGETFFDTALRKVVEEVGLQPSRLRPNRVLSVWNTFFNKSVHDDDVNALAATGVGTRGTGTQTVNTVVQILLDGTGCDEDVSSCTLSTLPRVDIDSYHTGYTWVHSSDLGDLDPYVVAAIGAANTNT